MRNCICKDIVHWYHAMENLSQKIPVVHAYINHIILIILHSVQEILPNFSNHPEFLCIQLSKETINSMMELQQQSALNSHQETRCI